MLETRYHDLLGNRRHRECTNECCRHREWTIEIPESMKVAIGEPLGKRLRANRKRWALRQRDIEFAQDLHRGWELLAKAHGLDRTSVYRAAARGRRYLKVKRGDQ